MEYESNGNKNRNLSIKEYLNKIHSYLKNIINNLKKIDTWNIQSTIVTNFTFSKDTDEQRVMHQKSDKMEIMNNNRP